MKKLLLLLLIPTFVFGQTVQFKSANVKITGGAIDGTTVGSTTPAAVAATTISATGAITSTLATGTAPFTVASTTQVANLNAATAGTATNQSGGTVAATTVSATGTISTAGTTVSITPTNGANAPIFSVTNTGGTWYYGADDSTGGSFTGTPYAGIAWSNQSNPYIIGVGNARKVTVSTTGVAIVGSVSATAGVSGTTAAFSSSVTMPGLASSSAATTGTLCWTTGTGNVNVDTTTTCLLSARKYKQDIVSLDPALGKVLALRPVSYQLKPEFNPDKLGRQVGFIADEVQKVDARFVSTDSDGAAHAVRYQQMTALLVKAMQEQQKQIDALKKQLKALHKKS